eukprot:12231599-Alexandrium_andersonii.AAC.1
MVTPEEGAALRAGGGRGKGGGSGKAGRGHSRTGRQQWETSRGRGGARGTSGKQWRPRSMGAVPPSADLAAAPAESSPGEERALEDRPRTEEGSAV